MPSGFYCKVENDVVCLLSIFGHKVNRRGEVFHALTNKKVPSFVIDGVACVSIPGIPINGRPNKEGFCSVMDLVGHAFKTTHLTGSDLLKIKALPVDGDETNFKPENIIWMFPKEGINVIGLSDFKYIPGYTKYAINVNDLTIINVGAMYIRSLVINNNCYEISLRGDGSKTSIVNSLHRLACLTFIPYTINVKEKHVNHKDGDRFNNQPSNLEWVTIVENSRHGIVRRLINTVPPDYTYMKDKWDKEKSINYYKELGIVPKDILLTEPGRLIKRLNVHTMEIVEFDNRFKAIKDSGIIDNQFYQSVNSQFNDEAGIGLVKGKYIFRYDTESFPEITPEVLLTSLKQGGHRRPVLVKDLNTGEEREFTHARAVMDFYNKSKSVVTERLRLNIQKLPGTSLLIKYKDLDQAWNTV